MAATLTTDSALYRAYRAARVPESDPRFSLPRHASYALSIARIALVNEVAARLDRGCAKRRRLDWYDDMTLVIVNVQGIDVRVQVTLHREENYGESNYGRCDSHWSPQALDITQRKGLPCALDDERDMAVDRDRRYYYHRDNEKDCATWKDYARGMSRHNAHMLARHYALEEFKLFCEWADDKITQHYVVAQVFDDDGDEVGHASLGGIELYEERYEEDCLAHLHECVMEVAHDAAHEAYDSGSIHSDSGQRSA